MRQVIIAILAMMIALQAGLACGAAQATEIAVKTPCCGANCPVPSAANDQTCCQVQDFGVTAAEAVASPPKLPLLQPLIGFTIPSIAVATLKSDWQAFPSKSDSPPGAVRLALLCSRQI